MADEEYEIIPHQLLSDLKFEVEALKKKLTQPDAKINELVLEIEGLKDSIHDLHTIFQKALEEVKGDDLGRTVSLLRERMETISRQNETIAQGMVAISEKVDDWMRSSSSQKAPPTQRPTSQMPPTDMQSPRMGMPSSMARPQHQLGMPPIRGPARVAPSPMPPMTSGMPDLPPPPPPGPSLGKKRRGIFS
ncbi:MAG: hypothetical protein Q8Q01_00185 [archaeon]|nr:hypothetical protein [archaeon]